MTEFLIVTAANLDRAVDKHPQPVPGCEAGGMIPDPLPLFKAHGKSIDVMGDTLFLKRWPHLSQLLQADFFLLG